MSQRSESEEGEGWEGGGREEGRKEGRKEGRGDGGKLTTTL